MWKSRIVDFMQIPAEIADRKAYGKYTAVERTCGPDRLTPLKESLTFIHVSGLYTILSGALMWAARRLEPTVDVKLISDLSVALFCYQHHEMYYAAPDTRASMDEIDNAGRFEGPMLFLLDQWYDHRIRSHDGWPVLPPHDMIGDLLTLTKFTLGKEDKGVFDSWVSETVRKMDELVPFFDHDKLPSDWNMSEKDTLAKTSMGPPLPPHVLDRRTRVDPEKLGAQSTDFLQTVDWESNLFLASPSEMKAKGFTGDPYERAQ